MNFEFEYQGKKKRLRVEPCEGLHQLRGLMFRKKGLPLLFTFSSVHRRNIHSFFCVPFVAIWFRKGIIIEQKHIRSWQFSICPREEFDTLLEIPCYSLYYRDFSSR